MEITITKEQFEKYVPVAASAHDEIYESVKLHFNETLEDVSELYLGEVGCKAAEESEEVMEKLRRLVAVTTFLLMMEQKDVVLTPTGFGVVSNQQVAPASMSRVNAVHESLQRDMLLAEGKLFGSLVKVDGWGEQPEAELAISLPLWSLRQLQQYYGKGLKVATFHEYLATERRAMEKVREWIGDETVDFCMLSLRTGKHNEYDDVMKIIESIVISFIDGDMIRQQTLYRKLLHKLECNLETYTLYAESEAYKANIENRYENKQEDSAFF